MITNKISHYNPLSTTESKEQIFQKVLLEFNSFIQESNRGRDLAKDWIQRCLSEKNSSQSSSLIHKLAQNRGMIHQKYTRGFIKALTLGFIYEKKEKAFDKNYNFQVKKFKDWLAYKFKDKESGTLLSSYIKDSYLDDIKINYNGIICFGESNYANSG